MNNLAIIKGNLTRDVEVKVKDDRRFAVFTVASSRGKEAPADFIDVFCFADFVIDWMKDVKKGHPVYVEGKLNTFKDKDGHYKTRLMANYARPFVWEPKDSRFDDAEAMLEQMEDPGIDDDVEYIEEVENQE